MIDLYDMINERILSLLDQGVSPWRKPWSSAAERPLQNLFSRKPYRGINTLLLGLAPYKSPYWLTFRQARQAGGNVRKGEKASVAVFWTLLTADSGKSSQERTRIPLLRYYSVFNAEQCEGVAVPDPDDPVYPGNPLESAMSIVKGMPDAPKIVHESNHKAFYDPARDVVNVPEIKRFPAVEQYHATLFHELAHSTGHSSRLNRDMSGSFGSVSYGREELIAEMASAYLCGLAGIVDATIDNSASYIDSWRRTIKADKRAVVVAAGAAQKAVDYITNRPASILSAG